MRHKGSNNQEMRHERDDFMGREDSRGSSGPDTSSAAAAVHHHVSKRIHRSEAPYRSSSWSVVMSQGFGTRKDIGDHHGGICIRCARTPVQAQCSFSRWSAQARMRGRISMEIHSRRSPIRGARSMGYHGVLCGGRGWTTPCIIFDVPWPGRLGCGLQRWQLRWYSGCRAAPPRMLRPRRSMRRYSRVMYTL